MPIKGTWREKLNNINDYDRLIEMNKNIRDHYEANYSVCIMDGFMSMGDCNARCVLYSEFIYSDFPKIEVVYHCDKCIQDFLNEQSK